MDTENQIISILQHFGISNQEQQQYFLNVCKTKEIKKGAYLVREGQTCRYLYFLHRGAVSLFLLKDGTEYVKDFSLDNKFVTSFTSFNTQTPSKVNLRAEQDCVVSYWDFDTVQMLKTTDLEWATFGRKVAESLFIRKEKREISLLMDSAEVRYQNLLLENPLITQVFPQYLIASYLGIRPQSLSRIRSKIASS